MGGWGPEGEGGGSGGGGGVRWRVSATPREKDREARRPAHVEQLSRDAQLDARGGSGRGRGGVCLGCEFFGVELPTLVVHCREYVDPQGPLERLARGGGLFGDLVLFSGEGPVESAFEVLQVGVGIRELFECLERGAELVVRGSGSACGEGERERAVGGRGRRERRGVVRCSRREGSFVRRDPSRWAPLLSLSLLLSGSLCGGRLPRVELGGEVGNLLRRERGESARLLLLLQVRDPRCLLLLLRIRHASILSRVRWGSRVVAR